MFVKRVLDRRPAVLLAHRGRGVDHPSAAANIAALVETCATRPGDRVLNAADPDAPDARTIARVVAVHFGHEWREVLQPYDAELSAASDRGAGAVTALLGAARRSGAVRADLAFADIGLLLTRLARPLPPGESPAVQDAVAQRHLAIALAGLRPDDVPLPGAGLDREQLRAAGRERARR